MLTTTPRTATSTVWTIESTRGAGAAPAAADTSVDFAGLWLVFAFFVVGVFLFGTLTMGLVKSRRRREIVRGIRTEASPVSMSPMEVPPECTLNTV
jgi:hypothetical protein